MRYIPILRFKQVELSILQSMRPTDLFPLLEIVDKKTFGSIGKVIDKFRGEIMVELPLYLTGRENKHFGNVMGILGEIDEDTNPLRQAAFYKKHSDKAFIPVVSPSSTELLSYKDLLDGFSAIKNTFSRVAIRVFVTHTEISQSNFNHIKNLLNNLREDDIVLLDVVQFDGVEAETLKNLHTLNTIIPQSLKDKTFVLNEFSPTSEWRVDVHHYAPLLTKMMNLSGFGDFATIPRYESAGGGSSTTSIIRYFSPSDSNLVHFMSPDSFREASKKLKSSKIWATSISDGHVGSCPACKEVSQKDTEWRTFWKVFRIKHHIFSVMTTIIQNMQKYSNPQDLDIYGYDNISKKISNVKIYDTYQGLSPDSYFGVFKSPASQL